MKKIKSFFLNPFSFFLFLLSFVLFLFSFIFYLSSCKRSTEPLQTDFTSRDFIWKTDTLWTDNARWIELLEIWGNDENDVWAIGSSNDRSAAIWHWNGEKWHNVDPGFHEWVRGLYTNIIGFGKNDIWIVGEIDRASYPHDTHGALWHYDGTWHLIMPDSLPSLLSIWGTSSNNIYIGAMWNGLILKYDGQKFTKLTTESRKQISSIYGFNSDEIFSVVRDRDSTVYYFYKINSSGIEILDSYNYAKESFKKFGTRLWGTDANHLYSSTGEGITRYSNGQWIEELHHISITTLYGSANNNIFAAGSKGALFHFNGNNWKKIYGFTNNKGWIWDLWCNSNSVFIIQEIDDPRLIIIGTRKK